MHIGQKALICKKKIQKKDILLFSNNVTGFIINDIKIFKGNNIQIKFDKFLDSFFWVNFSLLVSIVENEMQNSHKELFHLLSKEKLEKYTDKFVKENISVQLLLRFNDQDIDETAKLMEMDLGTKVAL